MTTYRFAALAALALAAVPAQAAPPSPPPAAAAPDPTKGPFEALPEAGRRAIQADLIWAADFTGAVTGVYGPRTRDALLAYGRRIGAAPGAVVDGSGRARLLADADAARRAVGFAMLRDPRTGIAVGIPARLAPLRSSLPDGTRYAAADGSFAIALTSRPDAGPAGLADAVASLTRDAPGRRVTYRLEKPDFAVVSGEAGDTAFYARLALAPSPPPGSRAELRGLVVTHPKADRGGAVALAVAASFDPFPPPLASQAAASPPEASAAPAKPMADVPLAGQAVLVAPDLALTRIDRDRCADPDVAGAPARWVRQDAASGLGLLRVSGHAGAGAIPLSAGGDGPRLALFLAPGEGAPTLMAAGVAPDAGDAVRAPLQGAEAGAVLLDGAGALAGLLGQSDGRPVAVAGVTAEARYGAVEAGPIAAFLKEAAVSTAAVGDAASLAEAVPHWRPAILPLRCRAG